MLGCALAFCGRLPGSVGLAAPAAYEIGSPEWLLYGLGFLVFTACSCPGCVRWPSGSADHARTCARHWRRSSRPLQPLGLAAWVAFTISFAFAKLSYVLPVLSDPFGRGWDLFGTAHAGYRAGCFAGQPAPAVVLSCMGGLIWAGVVAREDGSMHAPDSCACRCSRLGDVLAC